MIASDKYREVELTCGHTTYKVRAGPDSSYVGTPFEHTGEREFIPTHPEVVDARLDQIERQLAALEAMVEALLTTVRY